VYNADRRLEAKQVWCMFHWCEESVLSVQCYICVWLVHLVASLVSFLIITLYSTYIIYTVLPTFWRHHY
jgi:hypothetical protein